ncbi:MAG: exonuclease SbcCD subunit D C-terminal domain-containing protein [Bacteroides sp.]|nr:exonuclease SbcCD subunit D C-terminal domain-containing protein [Bacteroides sp.]
MLKIIHTADWHLGQNFFGYDRTDEHRHFLSWLLEIIRREEVDACFIAGDLFDVSNPSAISQRLFYQFVREVVTDSPATRIIIIAGNHDPGARLEAPLPLLEVLNTDVKGVIYKHAGMIDPDQFIVPLTNRQGETEAWCLAVPFIRQGDYPAVRTEGNSYTEGVRQLFADLCQRVEERRTPQQAVVIMAHLYTAGAEISETDHSERVIIGGLESVSPESFLFGIAYTALGHIHKPQRVAGQDHIRYAGSPLPMSFAEKNYKHGVNLITLSGNKLLSLERIPYTPLCRLLSLPEHPAPPEKVYAILEKELEDRGEHEEVGCPPYLEIKVLLTEPEPMLRQHIEEILSRKKVRLGRIISSYKEKEEAPGMQEYSISGLQDLSPLHIAGQIFHNKYGETMPDELKILFEEVYSGIDLNDTQL